MEKAEKIGLAIAAAGHVALFGVLSLSILNNTSDAFRNKPIEVMIADEVGLESAAPTPALVPPATSVAPATGQADQRRAEGKTQAQAAAETAGFAIGR